MVGSASMGPNNRSLSTEVYSPLGSLIVSALKDIPTIPAKFDKKNAVVLGVNSEKLGTDRNGKMHKNLSKMMLERIKKHSILNHDVFKYDGVNYK